MFHPSFHFFFSFFLTSKFEARTAAPSNSGYTDGNDKATRTSQFSVLCALGCDECVVNVSSPYDA